MILTLTFKLKFYFLDFVAAGETVFYKNILFEFFPLRVY